jgi:FtsP/CotA-like multicopper oxidase with cupredoxin domain
MTCSGSPNAPRTLCALLSLFGVACSGGEHPTPVGNPEPAATLTPAIDENPDSSIFEVTLEARESSVRFPGTPPTAVWTYNGTLPGPLIDAEVGNELHVHFVNQLPESTTIHWHGVRVPAAMDGTTAMQDPVEPGGTFEYSFALKDAGLFWFHPHVRSDEQVEKGLYGVIRVRGANEPVVDDEQILVLDDISVLPDGTLPTYLDDESKMLGRQGNVLLVNGRSMPTFTWRAGALQRLRLVNVANGRFFNLSLPGYTWRVIGTDGGLLPQPYDTDHVLISPGERYDVLLIVSGEPRTEVTLWDDPYDRGHDTGAADPLPIAKMRVSDDEALSDRVLVDSFPPIERLPDGSADAHVELDESLRDGEQVFTIDGETYPDVPPIDLPLGEVRRLEVQNLSPMDHPFHVHGTFFQVLEAGGVATPVDALANKDTVVVPQMSTLKLALRYDEPGDWMYHCHILEHAEGGMMGEIKVEASK